MSERIIDVEDVPQGTRCLFCGHANGETTRNGSPFVQPFIVRDQATQDERWMHWGCAMDKETEWVEHERDMREIDLLERGEREAS